MVRITATLFLLVVSSTGIAGPYVPAGDKALRHDLQRLADHGIIKGTMSMWPMAWGPILRDIGAVDAAYLSPAIADALARVKRRAGWETTTGEHRFQSSAGVADNRTRIRSYENTPRGRAEVSVGADWIGDWANVDLNVQYVDSDRDDEEVRADNSMIGIVAGNWSIAGSTYQRWWGPGHDGSLILSNNARPIPSLVIDRVFTDAFETKWLSWLGPWDFNVMFGQLEKERAVPDTLLFGMRFNFRPIPTLELGLSRTAQWCGDHRPCDFDSFWNMFKGNDNVVRSETGEETEPGNQLAGYDLRWTPRFLGSHVGIYGQFIGEDEAGGLPSRFLGQFGVDWSGYLFDRWSSTAFLEFSDTTCEFQASKKRYECSYNHDIYETGYRYRGYPIGHGADNDAELFSLGLTAIDIDETEWRVVIRFGELNAGGLPDPFNTLTPTPQDIASIDLAHRRVFRFGSVEAGLGYEAIDDLESGQSSSETGIYLQWRSAY